MQGRVMEQVGLLVAPAAVHVPNPIYEAEDYP